MVDLAENCGWWWPFEGAIIMTERPTRLTRDDRGRLHNESDMAIQYGDGWGVYAWHGVRVPEHIITKPEELTPEVALGESNQEIRRVMLERYGWERLLTDLNATLVQSDRFGKLVQTEHLGRYLEGEDPVARFVIVRDSSSERSYCLRVPRDCETAHEGVARTFGLDSSRYNPIQEA
jgi:hypothetical protein